MKVCLANDSFPPLLDGVSNTITNYAAILSRDYGSAVVATPWYPGVQDNYPFEVIRYRSLNTTKVVGYRTGYPFAPGAMKRLMKFQPELIHSHCPFASTLLARELRELTNAPVILTYHTKFDIDIKRAIKMKILHEPAIRALIHNIEACDDVWVVNEGAGENLKELGFQGHYTVMPNGVDMPCCAVAPEELREINTQYRLGEAPVFLFVGRMFWYKGQKIILDALRQLKANGQPFRMLFVGDGGDRDAMMQYAMEIGLQDDCVFTGAIYDRELLRKLYSRADLFLLPSVFDNNPLVVKEAAACGTASALIRNSSSAEGVVDGKNGVLMEESPENLYRSLKQLCQEPEQFSLLGAGAANDLYRSWEDSIRLAYARYEDILHHYEAGKRKKVPLDNSIELISFIYKKMSRAGALLTEGRARWEEE